MEIETGDYIYFGELSSLNPVKKLWLYLKWIHLGLGIYSIVEQSAEISLNCIFFHRNVPWKQFEKWRIFFNDSVLQIAVDLQFFLFNHNYFYLCCWVRSWQYCKAFDLLSGRDLTKTRITKASRACGEPGKQHRKPVNHCQMPFLPKWSKAAEAWTATQCLNPDYRTSLWAKSH